MFSTAPLSLSKLDAIKSVPGVAEVSAQIGTLLDPEARHVLRHARHDRRQRHARRRIWRASRSPTPTGGP